MGRGHSIDRGKLHAFLFNKADHQGKLKLVQKELADNMGVANETICRVLKKMGDEGRMKRMGAKKNNVGVYFILDPAVWEQRKKALGN